METKIIKAVFGNQKSIVTIPRMQYDYGQVINIIDVNLPATFEARFSNQPTGRSVRVIGENQQVAVPDELMENAGFVWCYITVHDEVTDGRTMYTAKIPINPATERTDAEPTPVQQDIITQAIAMINSAVDTTSQKASEAFESADRAEQAAEGVEGYAERAEAAQNASESARDRAVQAETNSNASAATATEKANEAIGSATTASQSALNAETASESAQEYATASAVSASASAVSASQASEHASTAGSKATEASGYASTANASAQTASQKALEAAQSASTAVQAKTDAESAKTASQTAQGLAESARDGAVTAKEDAESARDEAQDIVDGISGKVEQIDSNTERIESLEDDRYKPYVVDSASGSIASFPDGADGIQLKSCIVQVEPVQDLHGYDSPWPAGGGKNKVNFPNLSIEAGVDKQLDIGTVILPAGTYTFSYTLSATVTATRNRPLYLLNGVAYYGNDIKTAGRGSWTFTLEEQSTLAFKWWGHTVSAVCTISDFQLELGSIATDYAPYENICPISGFTGCEVYQADETALPPISQWVKGFINANGGTTGGDSEKTERSTDFIPAKPLKDYVFKHAFPDGFSGEPWCAVGMYDKNKNFITLRSYTNRTTLSFTTTAETAYIRASLRTWGGMARNLLLVSDELHTYPITFPSEAGIVYGAYVDVLNGELVVDRAQIANYNGETLPSTWISDRDVYASGTTPTIGAQVVYKLAEPIHYPITSNQINSLYGQNNIWANTGDTEVEYRADTRLYIKRLTDSDTDMVADANIVSGQYFMVGNDLYRATANIASGASVIVGTNAVKVSLAQALNAINT